jgi:hypothetical protein
MRFEYLYFVINFFLEPKALFSFFERGFHYRNIIFLIQILSKNLKQRNYITSEVLAAGKKRGKHYRGRACVCVGGGGSCVQGKAAHLPLIRGPASSEPLV